MVQQKRFVIAERREVLSGTALQEYIEKQIRQAATVWGINTPLYGEEGSYSEKEKKLAQKLGIYRSCY